MVMETRFNLEQIIVRFNDERMTTCMGSRAQGRGTTRDAAFSRFCSRRRYSGLVKTPTAM